MSDASPISLKVKLEEDIRRFSVSRDITYVDLRNLVAKHFALAPENVHLKYVDDEEELITLGSDLELQEAKRLQPTVLRLNAYAKSSKGTAPQEPSLEAQFVRDVTVPDSTSVSAGVRFEKVWRVKNSGPASWPTGVMLKMVDPSDNHLLVLAVGAIKRAVAPGEETDIGVELQAPSRPGRCHQHWRLFTPDGEAFGPRLWIEIMVTTSKESAQETEAEIRQQKEQERLEAERLEQELAIKKIEELEERRRLEEAIELQRQALQEELRKQQEEEEERLRQEEAEARRLQEEAAAAAAAEEARKMQEELRKRQEEEEERQRQEEEAAAAAAAAAAERLRRQQEEEAEMARKEQVRRQEEERKKKEEEEKAQQLFRKYPSQLVALTEMGFSDLERNVQLLDRHKGSLDLALEALLSATN